MPASTTYQPLEAENRTLGVTTNLAMKAANPPKILVMDDDLYIREVAALMLKRIGYGAFLAPEGEEALRIVKNALDKAAPIDIAIVDLTIPGGLGGLEILPRLHELDPAIKVIASSGYSGDPIMLEPRKHGFSAALVKPYQKDQLSVTLARVLSQPAA
jgi:two-component system cell cycle sensor histidine kinase/response regulator CckA